MATIKLSPGNNLTNPTTGTIKDWFGSNFAKPNFPTEKSVGFDANEIRQLCNGAQQLVLTKHEHNGKKTLAIAGIDSNLDLLSDGTNSVVLVGNHFDFPTSPSPFALSFANLYSPRRGEWLVSNSVSNPSGSFETQMNNFQKTSVQNNLFLTVNFEAGPIRNLTALPNVSKITFLPGFVSLLTESIEQSGNYVVPLKSSTSLEVLIAFAVDANNNVVGEPVIPLTTWPEKWRSYNNQ